MLEPLEHEVRTIADLRSHILIRVEELLTSCHQLKPCKFSFEPLLQEVMANA